MFDRMVSPIRGIWRHSEGGTINILTKVTSAFRVFKNKGYHGIVSILLNQCHWPIPKSHKFKWNEGIDSELRFWDAYLRTKGLQWHEDYGHRLDPDLPLQEAPAALLPSKSVVQILDVGAGPLTWLGKKCVGKKINIIAIDALADEYDKILDRYLIQPLVRTQKLDAEKLSRRFRPNTFDLVVARNCLDHSYNPERAIVQMIDVVKKGMYVLLEHKIDAAERENYAGLHQWKFSMSQDGDFIITSKVGQTNMTNKYKRYCTITCHILDRESGSGWLVTRILKT